MRWSRRIAILLPLRQIVTVATVGAAVARTRAMSGPPLRAETVTSSVRQGAAGTSTDGTGPTDGVGAAVRGATAMAGEGAPPTS